MARAGVVTGGERQQIPIKLIQIEFARRWSLHVLPSGYTRTRRFGGWSNTKRAEFLELLAKQLCATDVPLAKGATDFGPMEDLTEGAQAAEDQENRGAEPCQSCGGSLIPHSTQPKP